MAERELSVILKLGGMEEGARKTAAYADANKKAAASVDGLTDAERRLMAQQRQLSQVTGQMVGGGYGLPGGLIGSASNPAMPQPPILGGPQQRANPGAGGIPGPFKAFLGLAAGAAAVQGFGQGLKDVSGMDPSASFGQAFSAFTGKMLESVPIVGNVVRGLGDMSDALTGVTATIEANKRGLATSLRSIGTESTIRGIQFAGNESIISAGSGLRNSQAGIGGQEEALRRLGPNTLGSFRPIDIFGNVDAGLGAANRGVFDAQTNLSIAQREAQARRAELAASQAAQNPELDARIAEQRGAAGRAQGRVASAQRAIDSAPGFGLMLDTRTLKSDLSSAQANAAQQQAALAALQAQKQAEVNALKERQQAIDQANVKIAQQELELAKANVEVQKQKVVKLDEQISRSRGGAVALGMAAPGESDSLLATVRQLKEQGFGSLSPEQKSQLSGNPLTAALAQQQAEVAGLADPNNAAIRGLVGQISPGLALPDLSTLQAERVKIVDDIARQMIENEKAFQQAVGKALGDGLGKITDAITQIIELKVEEMRVKILGEINRGLVQGGP